VVGPDFDVEQLCMEGDQFAEAPVHDKIRANRVAISTAGCAFAAKQFVVPADPGRWSRRSVFLPSREEVPMADEAMRAMVANVPVPEFDTTSWKVPPPLAEATVAIVTTAALHRVGDPGWRPGDEGFRALPADARDLTVGHFSPNWDRSGLAADLNVAYPADRLTELAADGVIGVVAPNHLSFHGVIEGNLATLRLDSGPAAAKALRDQGVDVALLVPV
jgi:D-proline reductase (dithiol) PrdB